MIRSSFQLNIHLTFTPHHHYIYVLFHIQALSLTGFPRADVTSSFVVRKINPRRLICLVEDALPTGTGLKSGANTHARCYQTFQSACAL